MAKKKSTKPTKPAVAKTAETKPDVDAVVVPDPHATPPRSQTATRVGAVQPPGKMVTRYTGDAAKKGTVSALVNRWYEETNPRFRSLSPKDQQAKARLVEMIEEHVAGK